jgi:O-antigen/teichoic acid export membrane protein
MSEIFDRSHLHNDIEKRIAKSTVVSVGARLFNIILQLGSTAVLARLLSPRDFGLVAMVTVGIEMLVNFRELGLSTVTVQRREINHDQVTSLFWINVLVGAGFTLLMAVCSPLISAIYHEPQLTSIALVVASMFFLDGLSIQHRALLERQMRFNTLARIQVITQFLSKAVAILMALGGFAYWSLVGMIVSVPFFRSIMVWYALDWRPGPLRIAKGMRKMLTFGLNIAFSHLFVFVREQLDNFLIGKYLGAHALGIYSRSYNLTFMLNRLLAWPLSDVMVPSLSTIQKNEERFKKIIMATIQKLAFIAQPISAMMFICAQEMVSILLGPNWKEAVNVIKILSIWSFSLTTNTGSVWILIALNKSERLLRWRAFECMIMSSSIIVGLKWGMEGVAMGLAISVTCLKVPEILYCYRGSPLKTFNFIQGVWQPASASVSSAAIVILLRTTILYFQNSFLNLFISSLLFGALYILFYGLLSLKNRKEIFCLQYLKDLLLWLKTA